MGEDGVLHPADVVPRLNAELRHQNGAQVLEDPQGLGLAPGAVERQHALRPQPLPHRVGAGQRLELAHECLVVAHGEAGVHPQLNRREEEFLQPARLGPGEGFVAHLAVGGTPPEVLGLPEPAGALGGAALAQHPPGHGHQLLEPVGIRELGGNLERVARMPGHDEVVRRTRLAQALAQPRDGRAERDLGTVPLVVDPQGVDQPVDRDHEIAVDEKPGHQGPRLGAPQVDHPARPGDLDRAEDADLQPGARDGGGRVRTHPVLPFIPRHIGSPDSHLARC